MLYPSDKRRRPDLWKEIRLSGGGSRFVWIGSDDGIELRHGVELRRLERKAPRRGSGPGRLQARPGAGEGG